MFHAGLPAFRFGVDDVFILLDFYAAYVFGYRSFGTAYRSHLQGASIVLFRIFFSDKAL